MDKSETAQKGKWLSYTQFDLEWDAFELPVDARPQEPDYRMVPDGDTDAVAYMRLYGMVMDD